MNPQEEYMVIIDPDTIIRKPLDNLGVERGKPIAQRYDYLTDKNALAKLGKKLSKKHVENGHNYSSISY